MTELHDLKDRVFPVNKSAGRTSFEVVEAFRRLSGIRKVGHAGTLDPQARGLLLLLSGRATRAAGYIMELPKTYLFTVRLGVGTDTLDTEGEVTEECPCPPFSRAEIEPVLERFVGAYEQLPPRFSAIKRGGKRLYEAARRGETVEVEKRKVRIHRLRLLEMGLDPPRLELEVECSKGTYVRALARDIGSALGVPAHVAGLVRTRIGPFHLGDAVSDDTLFGGGGAALCGLTLEEALDFLPAVIIARDAVRALMNGVAPARSDVVAVDGGIGPGKPFRIMGEDGRLYAVGRAAAGWVDSDRPVAEGFRLFRTGSEGGTSP